MLPLSANSDFKNLGALKAPSTYYDIDATFAADNCDIYRTDAIDQMIENIILTEPWERLFNLDFWSPFYKLLFDNSVNAEEVINETFSTIEYWTGITIDRENANINIDEANHEVSLQIPYVYEDNGAGYYHTFSRVVSQ